MGGAFYGQWLYRSSRLSFVIQAEGKEDVESFGAFISNILPCQVHLFPWLFLA